jgi:hypothetical protein
VQSGRALRQEASCHGGGVLDADAVARGAIVAGGFQTVGQVLGEGGVAQFGEAAISGTIGMSQPAAATRSRSRR